MTEHVQIEPATANNGRFSHGPMFARCSCGWQQTTWAMWSDNRPVVSFEDHRNEALRPAENQCRYCACSIPWRQAFCGDSCRRADARSLDARAEVLAAHRDDDPPEPILPGPDQIEMFP